MTPQKPPAPATDPRVTEAQFQALLLKPINQLTAGQLKHIAGVMAEIQGAQPDSTLVTALLV
jgi:hypothetical protein